MNLIPSFRLFLFLVVATFAFAWFGLIVLPWSEIGHLQPIKDEGSTDITPWDSPNTAHQGEQIYAANGCAYCHTQQIRPASSGADFIRGWATAKDPDGKEVTRRSFPRDYIWQGRTFLGHTRFGADLSNVGARFTDAASLYHLLYSPEANNAQTTMPAYKFFFTKRKIDGQPSADALVFSSEQAVPAGYEIVPTPEAKALVAYLLSLQKGYHLPDEKGPVPPPADKDKS